MAYAVAAVTAISILWFYNDITAVIRFFVSVFAVVLIFVPVAILWLLAHQDKNLPLWQTRFKLIANLSESVKAASPARVRSPKLLMKTVPLNMAIFLLDAGTLWTMMVVTGYPVGFPTAFVAIVLASIAGTVSFLPGGIGGFEAGAILALTLLGAPIEAALTGTLLFRGLTLWIPLIPGLVLARRDATIKL
jgi:uncharacterized membrane protein YbhN (UPF0104 family)